MPQVISPSTGTPDAPADSTLIQLGFLYALNYDFVVSNTMSSAQIFTYLPEGIATGLGLDLDQITMHSLVPYDTRKQLGFVTTLAYAYIPTSMVNTLQLAVKTPVSEIYNNPSGSVNTLMNYINPAIPILAGSTLAGSAASGTGAASAATSTTAVNNGVFDPSTQNTSASVKGATAGIALGAVGGAAAYGVAMFFIARRYKKRKQAHRRSNSVINPAEMMQSGSPALTGGVMMSGGRQSPDYNRDSRGSRGSGRSNGNSARTAQISAPMMAENSLGWN